MTDIVLFLIGVAQRLQSSLLHTGIMRLFDRFKAQK